MRIQAGPKARAGSAAAAANKTIAPAARKAGTMQTNSKLPSTAGMTMTGKLASAMAMAAGIETTAKGTVFEGTDQTGTGLTGTGLIERALIGTEDLSNPKSSMPGQKPLDTPQQLILMSTIP